MSLSRQELRGKLDAVLHLNGCQQRTAGHNEAKDGKDLDMEDMERLERETLDEALRLIDEWTTGVIGEDEDVAEMVTISETMATIRMNRSDCRAEQRRRAGIGEIDA